MPEPQPRRSGAVPKGGDIGNIGGNGDPRRARADIYHGTDLSRIRRTDRNQNAAALLDALLLIQPEK
jgi:hypothetical protein